MTLQKKTSHNIWATSTVVDLTSPLGRGWGSSLALSSKEKLIIEVVGNLFTSLPLIICKDSNTFCATIKIIINQPYMHFSNKKIRKLKPWTNWLSMSFSQLWNLNTNALSQHPIPIPIFKYSNMNIKKKHENLVILAEPCGPLPLQIWGLLYGLETFFIMFKI